jgi:hypothetical protein
MPHFTFFTHHQPVTACASHAGGVFFLSTKLSTDYQFKLHKVSFAMKISHLENTEEGL